MSRFKDELEANSLEYEIDRVVQSLDPTELLTDHQRCVVTEAIERGYYDSPRGCSLTDLASSMNISKSSVSGVLHRAEGQIIKEFFGKSIE
ncbi:helix-turn-helix domain-containing protein [Natrinema gelatinilyticum]|uniref:helix-turn-helix domain-containing protein n=1 Tax=Natrinema gelatinilyticum TaxID=2961571 RepID=UPI0020C49D1D|nr:helix-turn-helix domain-containing protein [Natrinema gelatinilyticum]